MGNLEYIQKIDKCYVGEDCVQVMVPHKNCTTVLNRDGILYYNKKGSSRLLINKYLEDDRRKQFPYSNIPIHQARIDKLFFMKRYYVNQLFEFNKPYFTISDNIGCNIVETYAIPHEDGALIVNKICSPSEPTTEVIMDSEEVNTLFETPNNEEESMFILNTTGGVCAYKVGLNKSKYSAYDMHENSMFPTDDIIIDTYRENMQSAIKRNFNGTDLDRVEKYIQKTSMSDIINCSVFDEIIMIKLFKDNTVTIDIVHVELLKENVFKVETTSIPVTKYTLEQIKYMIPKVINGKEPKFPKSLNPYIDYEEVAKSKKMVLDSKKR